MEASCWSESEGSSSEPEDWHEVVELAARLDLHDGEQDVGILRNTVLLGVVRHHVAVGHDGVRDQAVGDVGLERAVVGGSAVPDVLPEVDG